jgi:hypothetical protein
MFAESVRGYARPVAVGAAILADVCQIVDHADCIMVSPGMKRQEAERLGFRYAESAQHAMEMALARQGRQAEIAVFRHGGHILPEVADEMTKLE